MSEVARLRRQIDLEIEAMKRTMTGYASVASHNIINHRYERLGIYQEQLAAYIGPEQAMDVLIEAIDRKLNE